MGRSLVRGGWNGAVFGTTTRVRARRSACRTDTATLAANTARLRPASGSLLLSSDEAALFQSMKDNLPEGWVVDFEADADMAWIAFVFCAEAPRSRPMFTVCRWSDRLGLLAQWMDGTACSAFAFHDLEPVTSFILDGISEYADAHQVNVRAHGGADTRH
jgi:hypothetical protein